MKYLTLLVFSLLGTCATLEVPVGDRFAVGIYVRVPDFTQHNPDYYSK